MTTQTRQHIPWYLWPFAAIWKLLAVIVEMTGRFVAMVLGLVLILVGFIVSLTIVGAIAVDLHRRPPVPRVGLGLPDGAHRP